MIQPRGFNLLPNGGDQVRESGGHCPYAVNHCFLADADVLGKAAPLPETDVGQAVFTADFHSKFRLGEIDIPVWKDTRHIVERSQTYIPLPTQKQSIVFRMSVGSGD